MHKGEFGQGGVLREETHTKYNVPICAPRHYGESDNTHIHVPSRSRTVVSVVLTLIRTVVMLA